MQLPGATIKRLRWIRFEIKPLVKQKVHLKHMIFINGQMDPPNDRWIDRLTEKQTDRWIDRRTDGQISRQIDRQTNRPTNRQTDRPTNKHTELRTCQSCQVTFRFEAVAHACGYPFSYTCGKGLSAIRIGLWDLLTYTCCAKQRWNYFTCMLIHAVAK